jgi:hypothetical protein
VPVDGQFGRRPASNDNPGTNWYSWEQTVFALKF